jgi:lipoprotein-anchoring transpeptidase ErfK/SrfK
MNTLFKNQLEQISRREFLQMTRTALLASFWLPFLNGLNLTHLESVAGDKPLLGRILVDRVLVFDQPSLSGKVLKAFQRDLVVPITHITLGDKEPTYNRLWYELNGEGYAHSGSVQPVDIIQNPILLSVPVNGQLAEVTVPFTDTIWNLRRPDSHAYRLYYSTVYWITAIEKDEKGKTWYKIFDDKWKMYYYAEPAHLRAINKQEVEPLSPYVPADEKRIEIRLEKQVVIAYEAGNPVFMTRTATGAHFSDGDYRTPIGDYMTNRKRPSRHMAGGDPAAPTGYDLPGIPWVSYLTKSGISFHGTYWHNDYGRPRSHGCINLSPAAAKWVYRWCLPVVPFTETFFDTEKGTAVKVVN